MREPQAASTRAVVTALLMFIAPAVVDAQLRAPTYRPDHGWWLSGGVGATVLGDITDGASNSSWRFGTDPQLQSRLTIEKALDEFTSLGVGVGFGRADLLLASTATGNNTHLPSACQTRCAARAEVWTGMAQFRSGGGTGFHTLFEANAGATAFRRFSVIEDNAPVTGIARAIDLTGTLGAGFGYPLSRDVVLALVQDFGIGFHAKTGLPEGTGRSWRIRTTRAALRIRYGGR